jgi:hypothetical protein
VIQFDAAPAIPTDYIRLQEALSVEEIGLARAAGYVAEGTDPRSRVRRGGLDNSDELPPPDDVQDWRTRLYTVWFCYIYENLLNILKPMGAIEEIILEFGAPDVLDTAERRLGTLYAGAGSADPLSGSELQVQLEKLTPHYARGVELLGTVSSLTCESKVL